MASRSQVAGGVLGSVLAACAVAAPMVVQREGWLLTVSPDPIGIPTGCAGVTASVKPGQKLTDVQCQQMTAQALVQHGVAIAQCLPANLPTDTRAAFTSFSYNVGATKFCQSSVAAAARAGDLHLACRNLNEKPDGSPGWIYAKQGVLPNGKPRYVVLPGLVSRRAEERALCERGLHG